ncbi:MAG: 50S ribosomal protein L25 [Candidatus Nealsonbacteria bacterium]
MINLFAKIRKNQGKKVKALRKKGVLPAILYGPKIKNLQIEVNLKDFEKIYKEAGESTLISLEVEGEKNKFLVLIYDLKKEAVRGDLTHVDFYQPALDEEIEAKIPVILEGEAPGVKSLGGTLIKNISEIEVKALPQNLPKEFRISVEGLNSFEDHILIKDLKTKEGVKIKRNPEDIVVFIASPEKVEEELEKPIEEKVEEVEKIEKEKKEKEEPEEKEEKGKKE